MYDGNIPIVLKLKHRRHFTAVFLRPALKAGVIEMTFLDKPNSSNQLYRRTA